jgi:ankyrin repeat protein
MKKSLTVTNKLSNYTKNQINRKSKDIISNYCSKVENTYFSNEPKLEGAMFLAINEDNVEAVQALIEANVNINYRSKIIRKSLLQFAIEKKNTEIIKLFLKCENIDLNATNDLGENALLQAVEQRLWKIAYKMIVKGADIYTVTLNNSTLLHYLAVFTNEELMQDILEGRININFENNFGYTPLHLAALEGNYKIVELLLDHGADLYVKNSEGITPIEIIKRSNNNKIHQVVKFHDINYNVYKEYKDPSIQPFLSTTVEDSFLEKEVIFAINTNQVKLLKKIIALGTNVNCYSIINSKFYLEHAIDKHRIEIIKLLLAVKDINLNYKSIEHGENALHQAIKHGLWDIVDLFIKEGADIYATTYNKSTMLHYLAIFPNDAKIDYMLEQGLNINAVDILGRTPLHLALTIGNYKIAKVFFEHNARLNIPDHQGLTAFQLAKNCKDSDIKNILKQYISSKIELSHESTEVYYDKKTLSNEAVLEEPLQYPLKEIFFAMNELCSTMDFNCDFFKQSEFDIFNLIGEEGLSIIKR